MIKFCNECLKEVSCSYHEQNTSIIVDDIPVTYLRKYYICDECKNEFLDDLYDYDVTTVNAYLRQHNGIITIDEINKILNQYDIGKKPLSLILGLGEVNVIRYLNGTTPTKEISDILKSILNNPFIFELYLYANRDKISNVAYKKSLGKAKQLELTNSHSKLYNSALYIIHKLDEVDPLSLQKILYFANGFSLKIINKKLFSDLPMAWKHGPVYGEIYECFSYYKGDKIDYSELFNNMEFVLDDQEKDYLDSIIELFGCYSGTVLREMSHLTTPWMNARKGLSDEDPSNRIIEENDMDLYFSDICDRYQVSHAKDISKYSNELFKKAKKKLFS